MTEPQPTNTFAYEAQSDDGARVTGTVDAPGPDVAVARLGAMGLRPLRVDPLRRPHAARPLTQGDFLAFNQQLAHLAKAGLPLEHGLRLIAADFKRGRLAATVNAVADDLERGTPLAEAFERHRGRFPSLYGRLIDAGVRTGDLPGVLLSLGRHLELVNRLRGTLWRAMAYPLMVLLATGLVIVFVGIYVLPQFAAIFEEFGILLPFTTRLLINLAPLAPVLLVLLVLLFVVVPLVWAVLRLAGRDRAFIDYLILPLPLVGKVVRLSLVARWCDALRMGVAAGLDLPAALDLAGDATGSPRLRRDGQRLADDLAAGRPLDAERRASMLPATVPAAVQLSSGHHDLPTTLHTLTELYQRQAEDRLTSIPALLTPAMLVLLATILGFVIAALMMPLLSLLQAMTG